MCRRAHGAGYVTWIGVPLTQFRFLSGREHLKAFQSSDRGRRSFCQECGSTLFCESSHYPDMMDIVLANMDGPIDRKPKAHYYYSDRADWVSPEDDLPRFGGQSGTEPLPHHH